jgi:hypothetical protein
VPDVMPSRQAIGNTPNMTILNHSVYGNAAILWSEFQAAHRHSR